MATYITRRILQGILILFLSTFLSYSIILLMPGGPMDQYRVAQINSSRGALPPEYLEQLKEQYGLDKPYPLSYFIWLFDPEDTVDYNY
jgi:peptide/nickel transport system permease protein